MEAVPVISQAVVLAYGPGFHTHAAVARALALVGPGGTVAVVAALPTAREALELLALDPPAGVVVVGDEGSVALRAALEDMRGVPTLLLHDDVTIDAEALALLEAGHTTAGGTVVALVEDAGCDHRPDSVPVGSAPFPIRRVRPTCLLASPGDLYALSARSLVDPRIRLDDVSWGFHAVPGAVARHVGRCEERLLPPSSPDGRPLLVAAVIVRDEEATLPGLLASLEGVVDRVEVCDTGSLDRTIELARAAGCSVIEREWRDDFGWARNEILDRCRDACYVISVDADDRFHCDDPVRFRRQLATFLTEVEAYALPVRSRLSMEREDLFGSELLSPRVFRPQQAWWYGRIHELPCRTGTGDVLAAVPVDDPWIEHVGYTSEHLEGRDKAQRNIRISRGDYEADPTSGKAALEYARSLMLADSDPREQLALLQQVVATSTGAAPGTRASVLGTTAGVHLALGEHEDALRLAREALDLVPVDDIAARVFAEACEALGRGHELIARADGRAATNSLAPAFANAHGRAVWYARLAAALAAAGRVEDAGEAACLSLEAVPAWFDRWPQLVDGARAAGYERGVAALVAPLARDASGAGLGEIVRRFAPAATAELCGAVVLAIGPHATHPRIVVTGLLAALVGDRPDAMATLAGAAWRIEPIDRAQVAGRFEHHGRSDVAAVIRSVTPV
jgi:hypothetical protein